MVLIILALQTSKTVHPHKQTEKSVLNKMYFLKEIYDLQLIQMTRSSLIKDWFFIGQNYIQSSYSTFSYSKKYNFIYHFQKKKIMMF